MSNLSAEFFINKLEPIPTNKWIVGQLENKDGEKCTAGWLGGYFAPEVSILGRMLTKHFIKQIDDSELLIELRENPYEIVFAINDSDEAFGIKIKGTSPKERIMRILYQIRKKELQDGNVAITKAITNPKSSIHNGKENAVRRKTGCVTAGY